MESEDFMKKLSIKIPIVCTLAFAAAFAFNTQNAQANTYGNWVYEDNGYEAVITGYTGSETNVSVPSDIEGRKVVTLRGTFYNNTTVQYVYVPDSVSMIDSVWGGGSEDNINGYSYWDSCNGTFEGCTSLKQVTGAMGVKAWAEETFKRCSSLTSVKLYNITLVPGKMFLGCSSLKNISIPNTVKEEGYWAFAECTSLKKVYGGNGVKKYGEGVYRGCKCLSSVNIGKTDYLPMFMFYKCAALQTVKIPTTVKSIQYSAFAYSGLTSVTLPSSLEYVGGGREDETDREGAFEHCVKLTKVKGGKNVKVYGVCAFRNCKKLSSFSFGKVTKIQRYVFAGCVSLTKVTLPSTVKTLGTGAFKDCRRLQTVKLPKNLKTIENEVFAGCKVLKNLTIPKNVTTVYVGSLPEKRAVYVYEGSQAATALAGRENLKYVK